MPTESVKEVKLSIEKIIDLVRQVRNDLIHYFLIDDNLKTYFSTQYHKELSQLKAEFLKRDLKELLQSSVDLSHYAILIKQMQESSVTSLPDKDRKLFYKELELIFNKYNY